MVEQFAIARHLEVSGLERTFAARNQDRLGEVGPGPTDQPEQLPVTLELSHFFVEHDVATELRALIDQVLRQILGEDLGEAPDVEGRPFQDRGR